MADINIERKRGPLLTIGLVVVALVIAVGIVLYFLR